MAKRRQACVVLNLYAIVCQENCRPSQTCIHASHPHVQNKTQQHTALFPAHKQSHQHTHTHLRQMGGSSGITGRAKVSAPAGVAGVRGEPAPPALLPAAARGEPPVELAPAVSSVCVWFDKRVESIGEGRGERGRQSRKQGFKHVCV